MSRQRLVERSAIARKLGGPETIRKLNLRDRLLVSAAIAKELGRERAVRACEQRTLSTLHPKARFEMAKKYGLDEEAKEAAKEIIFRRLLAGDISQDLEQHSGVDSIAKHYGITKDEMGQIARMAYQKALKSPSGHHALAVRIAKEFGFEYLIKEDGKVRFELEFSNGEYEKALLVANDFDLKEEKKLAAERIFDELMAEGKTGEAAEHAKKYKLKEQMKFAGRKLFDRQFAEARWRQALKIAKDYDLDDRIQLAAMNLFEYEMEMGRYDIAAELAKEHGLKEQLRRAGKELLKGKYLGDESFDIGKTVKEFGLNEDDVREIAAQAIERFMKMDSLQSANRIAVSIDKTVNEVGLNEDVVREIAAQAIERFMKMDSLQSANRIAVRYGLDNSEIIKAAEKDFETLLMNGFYHEAMDAAELIGKEEVITQLNEILERYGANIRILPYPTFPPPGNR